MLIGRESTQRNGKKLEGKVGRSLEKSGGKSREGKKSEKQSNLG